MKLGLTSDSSLVAVKENLHNHFMRLRRVDILVNTQLFQEAWKESDKNDKEQAIQMMDNGDSEELRNWARRVRKVKTSKKSWKDLAYYAKAVGICGYSRMSKAELIERLEAYEQRGSGREAEQAGEESTGPDGAVSKEHECDGTFSGGDSSYGGQGLCHKRRTQQQDPRNQQSHP